MKRITAMTPVFLALLLVVGCGAQPATHALEGKVVLADGDVKRLADSHVEFELAGDPTVRADGLIAADGSFQVQSLHKGQVLSGLPAGRYRVRLVLDSDDSRLAKARPVGQRFLDFQTSGLSVQVPASDDITIAVTRR